jgi:hypothetical protein
MSKKPKSTFSGVVSNSIRQTPWKKFSNMFMIYSDHLITSYHWGRSITIFQRAQILPFWSLYKEKLAKIAFLGGDPDLKWYAKPAGKNSATYL